MVEGNILVWIEENLRNEVLDPIMIGITESGNSGLFWIALCLVLLCFKSTRRAGIYASFAMAASFVFNNLFLKNIVARTRPYEVVEGLSRIIEKQHEFLYFYRESGYK